MIWAPASVAWRSNIFCGGDVWSEIVQWKTDVSVTIPTVVSETHFQNTISSLLTCDLTFCFVSILKIWRVRPAREKVGGYFVTLDHECNIQNDEPFSANIFRLGCMIALSAVIGLRRTLLASARSMMTTWFC